MPSTVIFEIIQLFQWLDKLASPLVRRREPSVQIACRLGPRGSSASISIRRGGGVVLGLHGLLGRLLGRLIFVVAFSGRR